MKVRKTSRWRVSALVGALFLATAAHASLGDRLPDFKECVKVDLWFYMNCREHV
jgi:hypothetical protein